MFLLSYSPELTGAIYGRPDEFMHGGMVPGPQAQVRETVRLLDNKIAMQRGRVELIQEWIDHMLACREALGVMHGL